MKKLLLLLVILTVFSTTYGQQAMRWAFRAGFSPMTEDKLGIGIAYRPENGRWMHELELYPLQNRGSDITLNARNFGGTCSINYFLKKAGKRARLYTGAELYSYKYSREIVGNEGVRENDFVIQPTLHVGADIRIAKRLYFNARLPLLGMEIAKSKGSAGSSNHTTPLILGFFGYFQPKIGLDVLLF